MIRGDLTRLAMKNILFVTSEAVPFIKTGGLADVCGSLPKYIDRSRYDVRIMLPKYACMDDKFKKKLKFLSHFYVTLGWRQQYVGILESEDDGIKYYFLDNEYYFAGENPYNHIYEDVEKFAYFSKAALDAIGYIDFAPDIIHCHDWQTGLVPVYLKTFYNKHASLQGAKTVFTIHNLKFQGRWMIEAVQDITGLPDSLFTPDKLESYGEANYLKGGVTYSDYVTTVSPSYVSDIKTREGGEGLDGLFKARQDSLFGIINGLDYTEYDPLKDTYIERRFDASGFREGKAANKKALQEELSLPIDPDCIMIGMVSRMTDQKGFDLVNYIMEELLMNARVQIVLLGTGESRYESSMKYFENKYPDKISANIGYSERLAHRIYASCDAFMMPSLFEPCGLSQLMSMRYGTIPIVRETGGLKDTVEPYNEVTAAGSGFSFANFNAHEFKNTLYYAMHIYYDNRADWDAMVERDMAKDFSWSNSAKQYEEMYDRLLQ